jgi:hypothetical protein
MTILRLLGILLSGVCSLRVLAGVKPRDLFSSIGGRSINFPNSLLELRSGRHRITLELIAESIDGGAAVADVVAVPQVSVDMLQSESTVDSNSWPLRELLAEVIASSVISKVKPAFRDVEAAVRDALLAKGLQLFDRTNAGEIVDWVTTEGETLAQLPR